VFAAGSRLDSSERQDERQIYGESTMPRPWKQIADDGAGSPFLEYSLIAAGISAGIMMAVIGILTAHG
jgi:hypothetical protein